jgi:hypothetical protein
MEKKNNLLIEQAIRNAYLKEEKEKSEKEPTIECDEMVDKITKDLMKLKEVLTKMRIKKQSKPMVQVQQMYEIISNFKPSNTNLKEFVEMNTEEAASEMMKESKNKRRYYKVD